MIIHDFIWPLVIVGLPTASDVKLTSISKLDYTTPYKHCQTTKFKNSLDYNYIKSQELIESNNQKYQDILW